MHTNPTKFVVLSSSGKYVKDAITGKRWYWDTLEDARTAAQTMSRQSAINEKRARFQARVI